MRNEEWLTTVSRPRSAGGPVELVAGEGDEPRHQLALEQLGDVREASCRADLAPPLGQRRGQLLDLAHEPQVARRAAGRVRKEGGNLVGWGGGGVQGEGWRGVSGLAGAARTSSRRRSTVSSAGRKQLLSSSSAAEGLASAGASIEMSSRTCACGPQGVSRAGASLEGGRRAERLGALSERPLGASRGLSGCSLRLGHAERPLAHAGVHRLGGDPRGRHGGDLRVRDVLSEEGPASEELEEDEAGRPDVERGAKPDLPRHAARVVGTESVRGLDLERRAQARRRVQRDRERHRELGRHVPARVARGERRAVLDGTSKVDELEFACGTCRGRVTDMRAPPPPWTISSHRRRRTS